MEEFNEEDIVVRKVRAVDDRRMWIVVKVSKETLWLKPILGGIVIHDILYKGVRKEKMEVIGRWKKKNEHKNI